MPYLLDDVDSTEQLPIESSYSPYSILSKIVNPWMNGYIFVKDFIRNRGKQKPTPAERDLYEEHIDTQLSTLQVNKRLKQKVMKNVRAAPVLDDLTRTAQILGVLHDFGLKNEAADQFFLGGHFMINGGKLFEALKGLKDSNGKDIAEPRFSSHFLRSRIEELGISAGRILPEVLFLDSIDEDDVVFSHVQLEASPWRMTPFGGLRNYVPTRQTLQNMEHIYDSFIYFLARTLASLSGGPIYNRSSYGWSLYADNNPITSMNSLPSNNIEMSIVVVQQPEPASDGLAKESSFLSRPHSTFSSIPATSKMATSPLTMWRKAEESEKSSIDDSSSFTL